MTSEDLSTIRIKLKDIDGKLVEAQFDSQNASFCLSDTLVAEIMKEGQMNDLASCSLVVGANNIAIQITEYTLTPIVYIENFYNILSNISILQVKNVGIHIVKQKIDLLQVDGPSIVIAECRVNQFDAGLNFHSEIISGKERSYSMFENIDIRNCNIHTVQIFLDCKRINIQESSIDVLNMYGSMSKKAAKIERMSVWNHSAISSMTVQYDISKFTVEESTISNLIAKYGCCFKAYEVKNGTVLDAHNFTKDNFASISSDGWEIIAKSADNQGLLDKRAEAQYHVIKNAYRREKGLQKVFGIIIDFCTGFGYKPIRAIRACIIMILISWGLIVGNDIMLFQMKNITTQRTIMESFRIALTAIVGQSGLVYSDGFPYWIAFCEYIGAVVLFAMFVNALYVRYKD